MQIKQDPVTGLWARSDGAVCMPPCPYIHRFTHVWTFGCKRRDGYLTVQYKGKVHMVHRIVCCAFHGLPPNDKPYCDHKSRIKSENFASNLHWVSCKENNDNADCVDRSIAKYGARACEDRNGYMRAYMKAHGGTYSAKKKARGLTKRKGPDGKWGWFPFKRTTNQDKEQK